MNNAFCTGADGVIGYRNSKNFEQNWISAHYAIHFMRSSMTLHRPRSRMGLGTHIAGTGYLLSSDMLKDGWHYSTLTEDTQATMDFAVQGKRIEYCEEAEFFDEQPYQIKVMLRQRLRWAKGRMACFFRYGFKLFFGLVKPFKSKPEQKSEATNKAKPVRIGEGFDEPFGKMNLWKKIVFLGSCVMDICSLVVDWFAMGFRYIAKNFTNFDMIFYLIPLGFIYRMIFIAFDIYFFWLGWQQGSLLAAGLGPVATKVLQMLFGTLATYIKNIIKGLVIVVREWKHIRCPIWKMPFYLITWPLHDMIYPYICLASLFMHVTWKPIKHDVVKSIDEMNQ